MKFMSWSLNAPTNYYFDNYIQKKNGEWTVIDQSAIDDWPDTDRSFFYMYEENHSKVTSFGLHEFGVNPDGTIYDYITETQETGERTGDHVLNNDGKSIARWCKNSLQYLMDTYPDVRYAIQIMNFQGSGESKVDNFLDDTTKWDTCIQNTKTIADLYIQSGFPIDDIEVDFERSSSRDGDNKTYRDFLVRVKDEVCIPLGLGMRVNMYAMTADMTPHYYRWHDYKTLASGTDKNGNRAINEFQLMTYDFTYAYSAPGPSTPLWWLKEVLNHVDNSLPNDQTWIGNAGYGRRWGLDAGQPGSTVTYKQLLMWQNGMYVHNHKDASNNEWVWHDQPWLPFAGYNDQSSGYLVTYPHLYDKFRTTYAKNVQGTVDYTTYSGDDIITSYSKSQQPIFTNIHAVANNVSKTGNTVSRYTGGITIPAKYLGSDYQFKGTYRANKAQFQYDKKKKVCVAVPDETGKDGQITFNFSLNTTGNHKLIALVHFNTFQNNKINASLNGTSFTIGGDNLEEWWPFYVDKYAWIDVGSFDFSSSNTITISPSSGYIWGFVVCDSFDSNFLGGTVEFESNLQPFYKRDTQNQDGTVNKVQASMPKDVIMTGELLRRPPRPAIIFEDTFSHFLKSEGSGFDITDISYYMTVQDYWDSGSNKVNYSSENAYACTDSKGIQTIGFTDGSWKLQDNGEIQASVGAAASNQLVLYKKFGVNIQARADIALSGSYPKGGLRLLASREGDGNEGYLALLDYGQEKVRLVYEDGSLNYTEIASAYMSKSLASMKGSTANLYATIHNGKAYVKVGETHYLSDINLSNAPTSGAFGVYVTGGTVNLSLFNISTTDRYEPLEKMEVEIDGQTYKYGEIKRSDSSGNTIPYDKYGYLKYSGLNLEGLKDNNKTNENVGGSSKASESFSQDFQNRALAQHPAWQGKKPVRVRMVDAGIWFTQFYIGDAEGFSVAYNSDMIGFVETESMIFKHQCKGVAMWTMGQEDPLIFDYLPNAN